MSYLQLGFLQHRRCSAREYVWIVFVMYCFFVSIFVRASRIPIIPQVLGFKCLFCVKLREIPSNVVSHCKVA